MDKKEFLELKNRLRKNKTTCFVLIKSTAFEEGMVYANGAGEDLVNMFVSILGDKDMFELIQAAVMFKMVQRVEDKINYEIAKKKGAIS